MSLPTSTVIVSCGAEGFLNGIQDGGEPLDVGGDPAPSVDHGHCARRCGCDETGVGGHIADGVAGAGPQIGDGGLGVAQTELRSGAGNTGAR